ncbi:membrane-spanning 4-domains subfamily A member 4A-like [Synchiropus splendidus]|uniref:membrane-spanning 4-domains subfamily A member 4A-like n=1 Tax=Synchiropus splendidus TaxID=270530 RepID=UPI00237E7708|nr:membrane-spanning 4-domains subfamily A member 4A-like [Synchiropus splendidus]
MMAEEAVVLESAHHSPAPLVAVTFQRNNLRKQKYLEGEPKALGITQIMLSFFQLITISVLISKDLGDKETDIPLFIASSIVVIAGILAIAAQSLHLPTLRGCLAMQIVACAASFVNMVCTLTKIESIAFYCWEYVNDNGTSVERNACDQMERMHSHLHTDGVVIHVTLLAISATLAAYCCKVVNCCAPPPKMPVITVQAPPVQE